MGDAKGSEMSSGFLQSLAKEDYFLFGKGYGLYGVLAALTFGFLLPLLLSLIFLAKKKTKQRGVPVEVGGEAGFTIRSSRFPVLVEVPWEGATTVAALFEQSCRKHAHNRFLGSRKLISKETMTSRDGKPLEKLHLGEYAWQSYREAFDRACNFASGLVKLGHDIESPAAIFAETRPEWLIAFQGCFRQNITVVTIYATLGEEALIHSLNETQVSTLICDAKQLKKLVGIGSGLDTVRYIVYFGDDDGTALKPDLIEKLNQWTVLSFSEVERLGKESPAHPRLPDRSDIAVIMYTSGSTGLPKGVMMTHGNIVATAAAVVTVVPRIGINDVYMAYLPLAHIFELAAEAAMFTAGCAIGYSSTLTLIDSSNKIKKGTLGDASVLQPTLMAAVPAILDRVRDGVLKKVEEKGGISKKLFDIGFKRRVTAIEGSWLGAWGLEKFVWDVFVFRKIRSILGGRIRGMLCGGAPLSRDTQRFINVCLGAPIGQGYGLTETCAGAAFSEWDDPSVGRVGPPLPCCFIKLVSWEEGGYRISDTPMPRGEIVIGGFSVTQGYFRNEEKTKEVYKVDERGIRWFYSGDIGQFHPDGCLEIIDRRKDIVKLQHGEYISLGKVEAALMSSNYVDNIMVYADPFHSYCVALIVPALQATESWAQNTEIKYANFAELCQKEETVREVQQSLLKEWSCPEAGNVLKKNYVPDWPLLATYLISEASLMESSRWSLYISALPRQPYSLLYWTSSELDTYLVASQIRERAVERITDVTGTYNDLKARIFSKYPHLFPEEVFNMETFKWSFGILFSRLVRLPSMEGKVALVPWADMLNHSSEVETFLDYDKSSQGVVFTTDRSYQPGEQVFISYGKKSNGELLLSYGFVPKEGTNPNDSVDLPMAIKKGDPCFKEKLDSLRKHGLSMSQRFPLQITGWPLELMAYAYMVVSPPSMSRHFDEMAAAASNKSTSKKDNSYPEIEEQALQFILDCCESSISKYNKFLEGSGTINSDVTSLKQANRKLQLKQLAIDLCTSERRILLRTQYILRRRLRDMRTGELRALTIFNGFRKLFK